MTTIFKKTITGVIAAFFALSWSAVGYTKSDLAVISEEQALEIAVEAYIYFYPLVTMDTTRRVMTNIPAGMKPGLGPVGEFHHLRKYPPGDFKEVVRPNFDTLYSSAWLDLSKEPMIVSNGDTQGRYFLLPMMDMWTDAFATPGWRTSGTGPQHYALVKKGWTGTLPKDVEKIESPTSFLWIIGRTQTDGESDYAAVRAVQDDYKVTPLSQWGKEKIRALPQKGVVDPSVDMKIPPLKQVNAMSGKDYFAYAAELLKKYPPHHSDWSQIARMKRIGIKSGESFKLEELPSKTQAAVGRAVPIAQKKMIDKLPILAKTVNGWQMNTDSIGVYGNYYLKRAVVSMVGLGANQPEDAIYPILLADSDGQPLSGKHKYTMYFNADEIPPVDAFWSLTLYGTDGFTVLNTLERYALGSYSNLQFETDGSLTIYLQHGSPGADKESNWLPAPKEQFNGLLRLYAPKPEALMGAWNPPPVTRQE